MFKNFKHKIIYLSIGLLVGCLFPIQSLFAEQPIKLIINGKTINCEVPPTIINGRTMVMARDIVENLGGQVAWDNDNRAVVITGGIQTNMAPSDLPNINNQSTIISNPVQIIPEKDNPKPPVDTNRVENENSVQKTTWNGMQAIIKNGETYVSFANYFKILQFENPNSSCTFNQQTKFTTIICNKEKTEIPFTEENAQIIDGIHYINIKFCK